MDPAPSTPDPTGPDSATIVEGKRVVAVGAVAFVIMLGLMLVARLYMPRYVAARQRALEVECAQKLRALGAAARAYLQDRAAFPHARAGELDGGVESADGPRAFRQLYAGGYLDDPASLVCPSAPRRGTSPALRKARRAWLLTGEGEAPLMAEQDVITYGWTRRALGPEAAGATPLAADRGAFPRRGPEVRGNHTRGWNVLRVDGSVTFHAWDEDPFPGSWLSATADPARDGFLGVFSQTERSVFDPNPEAKTPK